MQRWSIHDPMRHPTFPYADSEGVWVKYADVEAYAEEKRKEGVREGRRDGQAYLMEHEVSVREAHKAGREQAAFETRHAVDIAVQREREEIVLELQKWRDEPAGYEELFRRIRARGAICKECAGTGYSPATDPCAARCPSCKGTGRIAGPAPKLEHISESELQGDTYWAVKKLNAAIDAIESLREGKGVGN